MDDPDVKDMKSVFIFGGANDIECRFFETSKEFTHNIDVAVVKVATLAIANPNKTCTIVKSYPKIDSHRDLIKTSTATIPE